MSESKELEVEWLCKVTSWRTSATRIYGFVQLSGLPALLVLGHEGGTYGAELELITPCCWAETKTTLTVGNSTFLTNRIYCVQCQGSWASVDWCTIELPLDVRGKERLEGWFDVWTTLGPLRASIAASTLALDPVNSGTTPVPYDSLPPAHDESAVFSRVRPILRRYGYERSQAGIRFEALDYAEE